MGGTDVDFTHDRFCQKSRINSCPPITFTLWERQRIRWLLHGMGCFSRLLVGRRGRRRAYCSQAISDGIVPSWAVWRVSSGQAKVLPVASMVRVWALVTSPRRVCGTLRDLRKSRISLARRGAKAITMRGCDSLKRATPARVRPRDNRVPSNGLRLDRWGLNSVVGIEQNRNQAANSV